MALLDFSLHGVHRVRHGKISSMDLVWDDGSAHRSQNTNGMTKNNKNGFIVHC